MVILDAHFVECQLISPGKFPDSHREFCTNLYYYPGDRHCGSQTLWFKMHKKIDGVMIISGISEQLEYT